MPEDRIIGKRGEVLCISSILLHTFLYSLPHGRFWWADTGGRSSALIPHPPMEVYCGCRWQSSFFDKSNSKSRNFCCWCRLCRRVVSSDKRDEARVSATSCPSGSFFSVARQKSRVIVYGEKQLIVWNLTRFIRPRGLSSENFKHWANWGSNEIVPWLRSLPTLYILQPSRSSSYLRSVPLVHLAGAEWLPMMKQTQGSHTNRATLRVCPESSTEVAQYFWVVWAC